MGGIPAVNGRGERLLLYIGIIDILQSYRCLRQPLRLMSLMIYIMRRVIHCCQYDLKAPWSEFFLFLFRLIKKLEHTWKALVHDGVRILLNFNVLLSRKDLLKCISIIVPCKSLHLLSLWLKSFGQVNIQLCFETLWSLTFSIILPTSFIFILTKQGLLRHVSMNGV